MLLCNFCDVLVAMLRKHTKCVECIHLCYQCTLGTGILYFIDIGQWWNLSGLYAHQMGIKYIYIYTYLKKTVYMHVASSWHRNSWVCKGRQLHLPIPWTSESAIGIYCLKTGNYFPKGYVG